MIVYLSAGLIPLLLLEKQTIAPEVRLNLGLVT